MTEQKKIALFYGRNGSCEGNAKQVKKYPLCVLDENNTFYEWIVADEPMKPFVDLDGKSINIFSISLMRNLKGRKKN